MTNPLPGDERTAAVARKADAFAARLPPATVSFAEDARAFDRELGELLETVRQLEPRFAFDRDGRPGAIGAIRSALPAMELDIFDAVLEDHEAELAAWKEALYQGLLAHGRAIARREEMRREP